MHIISLTTQGFKCFKDKIVIDLFSPKHNVIVGANGSGKSNTFAAIQFVLDHLTSTNLRTEERKALLHEGAGAHVMSAYVEITLDNSDGRLPVDRPQVVIKRSIGLKKDEYFIDRKHVNKNEVTSMLETAGLSKSNPYNIVPQGKVNALTTMRDNHRLELLKEISGVKVFDDRRAESQRIMDETAERQKKIKEMLSYILSRLNELHTEKDELNQFQNLDRRRKIAEYTYYDKELRKAKAEIEKTEERRAADAERAKAAKAAEDATERELHEAERRLKDVGSGLQLSAREAKTRGAEHKVCLEELTKLEMALKQGEIDESRRNETQAAAEAELSELDKQVAEIEEQLRALEPSAAAKQADAERRTRDVEHVDAELQKLHSKESRTTQFSSKAARDKHLSKEASELSASLKKKETQAATLQKELDAAKARMGEAEKRATERRKSVADKRGEAEAARLQCASLRAERDKATDERKALWRKEQELGAARKQASEELERAQRVLQHSMSRQQSEAISAVRRIVKQKKIRGLHGMLIELISCDDKFNTAVDVAAGNQLFQVVVDTDDTAAQILTELQKANAGRVTFMPLNRLRPGNLPPAPEDCLPMMSKKVLKYDEKFTPAVAQVFRKSMLVRDLKVGARVARENELDCITLDGDQVGRKGAMTGGYLESRRSRMGAQAEIVRLSAEVERLDNELLQAQEALNQVDVRVTNVMGELHRHAPRATELSRSHELAMQKALASAELESLELGPGGGGSGGGSSSSRDAHRAAGQQKERAHAALLAALESDKGRLAAIEAEMATPFDSSLSEMEHEQIRSLHERTRELSKLRDAAVAEAARVEASAASLRASLSENLRPRQDELHASVARMAEERRAALGGADGDGGARLDEARERLASAAEALKLATSERDEKRQQERALQSAIEELRSQAANERQRHTDEAKSLDRLLSRKTMLLQKQEEFTACIRKLGHLPKDAFDAHPGLSSKQLLAEIEACHKELSKLGHVNKKALDQFQAFSDERDRLLDKQRDVDKGRTAITELIEHLDRKKDEAIERTFKSVSHEFTEVFNELVPGGSGKLQMTVDQMSTSDDLPESSAARAKVHEYVGVSIKVRFPGGGDATSMTQLSGGQKTMVALCLIFAIQRCDPAPFYIFDEIDAALDATHRAALARMIEKQASDVDANGKERTPTQFITTTFRPELIQASDACFGVTHSNKASTIKPIKQDEALRIIAEHQNRQRQHAGAGIGIASP